MNTLRVSLIQTDLVWNDPTANRARFTTKLAALAGRTDLVILPEMFTTGFSMDVAERAEAHPGPTLTWLREQSASLDAAVVGSVMVRDGADYRNRLYWAEPGGRALHYDKKFLFKTAGEHEHYTPGTETLTVAYRGWKIRPLVCYDLRFPEWSRNDPADPYDLLLYVASWPAPRAYDWRTLLAARAIENQAYVAAVNRVGEDGAGLRYRGDSTIIDPGPRSRLVSLAEAPATVTVLLELDGLRALRRRLPFLADR